MFRIIMITAPIIPVTAIPITAAGAAATAVFATPAAGAGAVSPAVDTAFMEGEVFAEAAVSMGAVSMEADFTEPRQASLNKSGAIASS